MTHVGHPKTANTLCLLSTGDRKRRSIKTAAIKGEYRFAYLFSPSRSPSYAFIMGSKLAAKIGEKSKLKNSDSPGI